DIVSTPAAPVKGRPVALDNRAPRTCAALFRVMRSPSTRVGAAAVAAADVASVAAVAVRLSPRTAAAAFSAGPVAGLDPVLLSADDEVAAAAFSAEPLCAEPFCV